MRPVLNHEYVECLEQKRKALKKIAKCLELGVTRQTRMKPHKLFVWPIVLMSQIWFLRKDDIEFIKMGNTKSKTLLPADISAQILKIIRGINQSFRR